MTKQHFQAVILAVALALPSLVHAQDSLQIEHELRVCKVTQFENMAGTGVEQVKPISGGMVIRIQGPIKSAEKEVARRLGGINPILQTEGDSKKYFRFKYFVPPGQRLPQLPGQDFSNGCYIDCLYNVPESFDGGELLIRDDIRIKLPKLAPADSISTPASFECKILKTELVREVKDSVDILEPKFKGAAALRTIKPIVGVILKVQLNKIEGTNVFKDDCQIELPGGTRVLCLGNQFPNGTLYVYSLPNQGHRICLEKPSTLCFVVPAKTETFKLFLGKQSIEGTVKPLK